MSASSISNLLHSVDNQAFPSVGTIVEKLGAELPMRSPSAPRSVQRIAVPLISSLVAPSSDVVSDKAATSSSPVLNSPEISRTDSPRKRHRAFTIGPASLTPTASSIATTSASFGRAEQLSSRHLVPQHQSVLQEMATTENTFLTSITRLKNSATRLLEQMEKEDADDFQIGEETIKMKKELKKECVAHFRDLIKNVAEIQAFSRGFLTCLMKNVGSINFTTSPVEEIATYLHKSDLTIFEGAGELSSAYTKLCSQSKTHKKSKENFLDRAVRVAMNSLSSEPSSTNIGIGASLHATLFQRGPRYELFLKTLLESSRKAAPDDTDAGITAINLALETVQKANREMSEMIPRKSE